jgi:ABC-2 type transport system ATP-binding protein
VVRDAVVRLGVGLVRMERRRHRMAEIFTTPTTPNGGQHVDAR